MTLKTCILNSFDKNKTLSDVSVGQIVFSVEALDLLLGYTLRLFHHHYDVDKAHRTRASINEVKPSRFSKG